MAERNVDKLLGQSGELVEERKKQMLAGALGIVQHYYEETPNKMEVVAALFGKKLGELFKVRRCDYVGEYEAYFAKDGYVIKVTRGPWKDDSLLRQLLTGQAIIVDENNG